MTSIADQVPNAIEFIRHLLLTFLLSHNSPPVFWPYHVWLCGTLSLP